MKKISVVVPLLNEEENIKVIYDRLKCVLDGIEGFEHEIIYVDDGSCDGSLKNIRELAGSDSSVKYISFSRNFGHEAATTAGFDKAEGDCVVVIDSDLQDPPELILEMIAKWQEGYHVVYAQRIKRHGENFLKLVTSSLFYRIFNMISEYKMPLDTGDFRLIDRKVLLAFRKMGDYNRMIRGMISWLGFKQTGIVYERHERHKGTTKYNFFKLLWLSFDAMTSFSVIPLRLSIGLGFFLTFLSIIAIIIVVIQRLFFGLTIPGYAFQVVSFFFIGGVQLFILGIIGEYIGKIYRQTQGRPLYIVNEESGFDK